MSEQLIDQKDLNRLTLQERLAEANGFAMKPPVFALGRRVNSLGVDNATQERQAFEAKPLAKDIFKGFIERIAVEKRRDATVNVNELEMLPNGTVQRLGNTQSAPLMLSDDNLPLAQLLYKTDCEAPGAAAKYLSVIPANRRAKEFNEWARATDPKKRIVLRTRLALDNPNGGQQHPESLTPYAREIFAAVTERYGTGVEVDALTQQLITAMEQDLFPGDARGDVVYDGRKAVIKLLWHSDVQPESYCAGEVFKTGVNVFGGDDGTLSFGVESEVFRNLCLNLIIIDHAKQEFGKKRHIGSEVDLRNWLFDALKEAVNSVKDFALLWDMGRAKSLVSITRDIPKEMTDETKIVRGVFRGLNKRNEISLPGLRGEAVVDTLFKSYTKEPEFNRVGIVNAMTRTAHEENLKGLWASETIEAQAGTILRSEKPLYFVDAGDII